MPHALAGGHQAVINGAANARAPRGARSLSGSCRRRCRLGGCRRRKAQHLRRCAGAQRTSLAASSSPRRFVYRWSIFNELCPTIAMISLTRRLRSMSTIRLIASWRRS